MIDHVCILGGGTSGLICALLLRAWHPKLRITIIESSTIGIVGVGEGSTEHWKVFINNVGISVHELITETGATYKTGIKFTNWNGDGKIYYHSIHQHFTGQANNGFNVAYADIIAKGLDALSMVPRNIHTSVHAEPFDNIVNQYHFDTFKLNTFLHKKCSERSIEILDRDIIDVELDQQGFVSCLIDKDNQRYSADFFVDCSGFKRVIASKLGAKWVSHKDHLPMNSAIAFPTEYKDEIPSYTESTAKSSGWMWRIPTQERFGNGYVYCDSFISHDKAVEEASKHLGHDVNVARSFKFDAGHVDRFWIKNCVVLGLAGSFVEPLEATSIGTSIQQSFALAGQITVWNRNNTQLEKIYNRDFVDVANNIIDYVQLHYITKRRDSEFWRSMQELKLTDFNRETLEIFKANMPHRSYFHHNPYLMFRDQNWIMIMHGLEMFNKESIKAIWDLQDPGHHYGIQSNWEDLEKMLATNEYIPHRQALEKIKEKQPFTKISFE